VTLCDRALGVSSLLGRTFRQGEERHGHVIDPRSGAAVDHTLLAAVTCESPTEADALSTALLVRGRSGLTALAARFPGAGFLVAVRGPTGVEVQAAGHGFEDVRVNGSS
jgi:FAD:protein FMN transferase